MENNSLKLILEALLMSSTEPLSLDQLQSVFSEEAKPRLGELHVALSNLSEDYETREIELKQLANGYRFQTRITYSSWVNRLLQEKPQKYSRALLEILAIIAYQQPVTRADIEEIRGVSLSSSILKTLFERGWIKIGGYRGVPGKPAAYITTNAFLDYFNLTNLNELPRLKEATITELEQLEKESVTDA